MKKIKIIFYTIILITIGFGSTQIYKKFFQKKSHNLYKAETPQKKTITQSINAAGILELKEFYKIGSQVAGIVKDVLIKENATVKKGQLLAEIELIKGDTDIRATKYNVEKAQQEYDYQKEYYDRQKQLYKSGQLAKNAFQRVETDYLKALDDLNYQKATLDKFELELKNSKIIAPANGIITNVGISKGMAVLNDFQNILFELAQDISEMKAIFDIDESEVGQVKAGQSTIIRINSYPELLIKSNINDVSFIPKNGVNNCGTFYKATAILNNETRILRPGMRLNGLIKIAKAKNVLCINSLAFQINSEILEKIAQQLKYEFKPLDDKTKKDFKKANLDKGVRTVWIVENNTFIQKLIIVGLNDETNWQIIDGLKENEQVLVDIQEPNIMDKQYGKWFQGAL
ncbi:MAG: efflux RND transporter periplasmic adaptor subunit [bacterium]